MACGSGLRKEARKFLMKIILCSRGYYARIPD
jgi:hypothetical protein